MGIRLALWSLIMGTVGCEGGTLLPDQPQPAPRCDGNRSPAPPVVSSPASDAREVVQDSLIIEAAGFHDEDGDAHRATRYYIWRLKKDGSEELVWQLLTDEPRLLTRATLDDGSFVGDAAASQQLEAFEQHVVRVAMSDDSGACDSWSPLSAPLRFRTDDGSATLFDERQILSFSIHLPPESIAAMNAEATPPGCVNFPRTFHRGQLVFGDQVFDDVGVRIKGGCGSSRNLDQKASLKVNLSWDDPEVPGCPPERRLFGKKRLTFNNGVQDQTAARERLGYPLYRAAGVPAPRAASVRIQVNGEDWGLYTHVETVDRRFLSRFFESNDGMMYEGAYFCDLDSDNIPDNDDDFSCFQREFSTDACSAPNEDQDPTDWQLLQELADELEQLMAGPSFYPEVEAIFDFEEFLSMWAVDSVLGHWDGYAFQIVNNYRVYHDPLSQRWSMIPWGIDQTFNSGNDNFDPFSSPALLVDACLNDRDCEEAFAVRLAEVVRLFELFDLGARARSIREQLRDHVSTDPRKEYSLSTWESQHDDLQSWITERPARIRSRLNDRGF